MKRIKVDDVAATPIPAHKALSQSARGMTASDTLLNFMTGMGGEKDKLATTIFGYAALNKVQLDAAYRGDWISRKVVDIPAYDAFREWREWQADKKDITAIEDLENKLRLQRKAMLALQRGRLYGGGALILGVDQGTSDQELKFESLGKDCLKFVHYVSRYEISAGEIEWDIMSPYFGEPAWYNRTTLGNNPPLKLHPSRVVRFVGHETADIQTSEGWGDSILQVCADAVLACGTVAQSVAQLVAEAKLDVIKIPELSESLSGVEYEARLKKRFGIASTIKSVFSMLIIDKEEEWERITQNFAGLPDILQMYLLIASGAADIPATRMLGQSPTGLSATGESDIRNYYDRVATEQKVVITPAMERLDKIVQASALGTIDPDVHYQWNALWQMDDAQKAEVAVKKATVMTADANAGLVTPLVLQKARENQLIEDGTYPGLEGLIEEFGDDIDEREPPVDPNAPAPDDPRLDPSHPDFNAALAKSVAPPRPPGSKGKQSPAKKKAAEEKKKAANDMAARIRQGFDDGSTPRTLYMRRDVLNGDAIKAWAKGAGFKTSLDDMHVTILYSKVAVDWLKVGSDDWSPGNDKDGGLTVKAGGPRVLEKFGKAVVLAFACSDLSYRHKSAMNRGEDQGISWSHDDYTPHITITYDGGALDILRIAAYTGPIELGPEIFEEINPAFNNELDAPESDYADYNPNHVPSGEHGGEFSSGGAGEGGRTQLVHQLVGSKKSINALKNEHQLIPTEVAYLKKLRAKKST